MSAVFWEPSSSYMLVLHLGLTVRYKKKTHCASWRMPEKGFYKGDHDRCHKWDTQAIIESFSSLWNEVFVGRGPSGIKSCLDICGILIPRKTIYKRAGKGKSKASQAFTLPLIYVISNICWGKLRTWCRKISIGICKMRNNTSYQRLLLIL